VKKNQVIRIPILLLRFVSLLTVIVSMLSLNPAWLLAQDSTGTTNADLERDRRIQEAEDIKREADAKKAAAESLKAQYEAEKAAAEAKRAAFEANLPNSSGNSPLPTGTFSYDAEFSKLTIEAQILVYQALTEALYSFVADAKQRKLNLDNSKIIIQVTDGSSNQREIQNALDAYDIYRYQVNILLQSCKQEGIEVRALTEPSEDKKEIFPAIEYPLLISKSVINLFDLFRTDTAIASSEEIKIESEAVVAELSSIINSKFKNVEVFYPHLIFPRSGLPFILNDLDRIAECQQKTNEITTRSSGITTITNKIDGFFTQLTNTQLDAQATPPIVQISKGARIKAILQSRNSYILYVGIKTGGTNRVTKSFFAGTKLRTSGGVIFYYHLINSKNAVELSGATNFYTGFQKVPASQSIQTAE